MPSFTNKATLSYNNITTSSNVVTGQLLVCLLAIVVSGVILTVMTLVM